MTLEQRLARIERKLGIDSEDMSQQFAAEIRDEMRRMSHRFDRIERTLFGEQAQLGGQVMSADANQASPYPPPPNRY